MFEAPQEGFLAAVPALLSHRPPHRPAMINAFCSFPIVVHPASSGLRIVLLRILLNMDGPCLLFYMAVSRLHLQHDPSVKRIARESARRLQHLGIGFFR